MAAGPSATPQMLCLDLHVHTPDEAGTWSSHGSSCGTPADESEGGGTGSSRASPDESECTGSSRETMADADESKSKSKSEGTESSRANSPDSAESLATSRSKGSFNWDQEKGSFNLEWASLAEFQIWCQTEARASSIELNASSSRTGGIHWTRRQCYVCRCEDSGGGRAYEKKHPEWQCKIGNRKSGCGCHIIIKEYLHTLTVLGRYVAEHDHEIGTANIAYTRLSGAARERIKSMLSQKIDRKEIVSG